MKLSGYPKVTSFTDNRGKIRWRFRNNGRTIYLPGEPGSREFDDAYRAAIEGRQPAKVVRISREKREDQDRIWREKREDRDRHFRFSNRIEKMLFQTQQRAKQRGREFALDTEWLRSQLAQQGHRCAITGIAFQPEAPILGKRINPFAPSFDRIDCSRGYTKDNVRIVLTSVNVALSDFGLEHFDQIAAARMQQIVKERSAV